MFLQIFFEELEKNFLILMSSKNLPQVEKVNLESHAYISRSFSLSDQLSPLSTPLPIFANI